MCGPHQDHQITAKEDHRVCTDKRTDKAPHRSPGAGQTGQAGGAAESCRGRPHYGPVSPGGQEEGPRQGMGLL